jgi:hypothetical protein
MRIRYALAVALMVAVGRTAAAAPCVPTGTTLVVDNISCELSGVRTFSSVRIVNGGVLTVAPYNGTDKTATGNLELRSDSITVDATSKIVARGTGYQTPICGDGAGPNVTAGGQGGCAVFDSGGGGAHFGRGGRGTKDIAGTQQFPRDFEEDCGNSVVYDVNGVPSCSTRSNCRAGADGLPTVAGAEFFHSIYTPEFGASGGDKGCRDGDGTTVKTAGAGGGRIVLASVNATQTGVISIAGTIDANGKRGCGNGNDSAGGGAGGTIFIVADSVAIATTAKISAAGGLGGDTQGLNSDPTGECTAPAQQGGTCDDCGGGGGGGIISVLSVNSDIQDQAVFNVNGALGGTCTICQGEAGGGVGELQISGGYVGEFCDGFDNDFDGSIDEDIPTLSCAGTSRPACVAGVPQICPPDVPTCIDPVTDTRARFSVIVDTSGSMLGSLSGVPTFGDGSVDHPGLDQDADGRADDSRLAKAKGALSTVIAAYPEIDFSLARYHQDTSVDRSCQMAGWFECNNICCSYDNPTNNTGTSLCNVNGGTLGSIAVKNNSPGDECINYAGNCGAPRQGADILVGFGADINQYLRWMDGKETNYNAGTSTGNFCNGGDCELRGTGPTPLANSLQAAEDYMSPIKACDAAAAGSCRRYGVILLTDGAESCQGDPVAAAASLRARGIDTFVVGFSVLASERTQLNAIAASGGTGTAFLVGDEDQLANALATIVSGSIVFETCNNLDDDCDSRIDEDFPQKGNACDDGKIGACRGTGTLVCAANGAGLACSISSPGASPTPEVCNGIDDNCNGAIDEGINCTPGCVVTSTIDLCNGLDDDCDGAFEEDDTRVGQSCGDNANAPCRLGQLACIGGGLVCVGNIGPGTEVCNGIDDNCDGIPDDTANCPGTTSCIEGGCRLVCADGEFPCQAGFDCITTAQGDFCVPGACANCAANEVCQNNTCVDPCIGVTCNAPQTCQFGTCVDCNTTGCGPGKVCTNAVCVDDPCQGVDCAAQCNDPQGCSCYQGQCQPNCDAIDCPTGQRCAADGSCTPDLCLGVTCNVDQVCVAGVCEISQCAGIGCGLGRVCDNGTCVDDPCKLITCSKDYQCTLRDGTALCVPNNPALAPDRVTAAGGGCDASGSSHSSTMLMFMLAMLGLRMLRHHRFRAIIALTTLCMAFACNVSPWDLNRRNATSDANKGRLDDGGNPVIDGGLPDARGCSSSGVDDTCDNIDNDCNGVVDDTFNKMMDVNNCGTCGNRCIASGAVQGCIAGSCQFVSCQPGFADLDADGQTCEYRCPLFPTIAEDCNGIDDDCDGRVDETLPAPPTGQCRVTAGTPCAGTQMVCATRSGSTRWFCDYNADVEFDPSVPNGIVLEEQKCDGKDGDCDAVVDDTFDDLNQSCDDGRVGVCRDVGKRVCDPADSSQTKCDLTVLPDAQPPSAEACDGKDNDCNGIVDDATGPNRVIDAMTRVRVGAADYYIDTYEASHPDATAIDTGVTTTRSCSNPNVLPWRSATFASATAACAAAGKILCTGAQWQTACEGAANTIFPYADVFNASQCNTESNDGIAGGADDDVLLATGAKTTCTASDGAFDMSGNLKEWTNDITGQTTAGVNIAVLRGGSYESPDISATCDFRSSRATVNTVLQSVGFRCCKATAP